MMANFNRPHVCVIARVPVQNVPGEPATTKDVECTIQDFSTSFLLELLKNKDLAKDQTINATPVDASLPSHILITLDQIISLVPEIQETTVQTDSK